MAIYNLTNLTESENIYETYRALNDLSNYFLSGMILGAIFFIILIVFKARYQLVDVLLGDTFVCTILAFMFLWLGLINWIIMMIFMLSFFAMIIVKMFVRD